MSRLAEVRKIHYLLQCSYSGGGGWNIFFFKIEEPINLYHAERHILSEPNMEVCPPPPRPPSECICPSLDSQGNHFSYMEAKKQWQHIIETLWLILVVCTIDLLFTHFFRVVYQNMHKRTCPCQKFKVFTLKINFTTILFKSNTKFSVILIMHKETFLLYVTKHKFQDR